MAVDLSSAAYAEPTLTHGETFLVRSLEDSMALLRPAHPVSLLDLSPGAQTGLAVAMAFRSHRRKIRIMTYEWHEPKQRERRPGVPDVLVERGSLPGLHFSNASFDYLIGLDVLSTAPPHLCCKLLRELRRIAMRGVLLVEASGGSPSAREGALKDMLLESGCSDGHIAVNERYLCLTL